mgnify:CR=1 FL=1
MLKIHHKITLATTSYESGKTSRLLKLDVRASLAVPVKVGGSCLPNGQKPSFSLKMGTSRFEKAATNGNLPLLEEKTRFLVHGE